MELKKKPNLIAQDFLAFKNQGRKKFNTFDTLQLKLDFSKKN